MASKKIVVVNNNSPGFENIMKVLSRYENLDVVEIKQKLLIEIAPDELLSDCYAIILSGGYGSVDANLPEVMAEKLLIDLAMINKIPTLGICYGFQLLSHFYGGKKLEKLGITIKEPVKIELIQNDVLFYEVEDLVGNQWHEEYINYECNKFGVFNVLAVSDFEGKKVVEAIKSDCGLMYGVQFHPERISDDANGHKIIYNFLDMFL